MIYVEHDKLETAANDFGKRHQALQEILDKLEAGLAPMVGSWEGSAQAMYVEKKAAWERASRDLAALLATIKDQTHSAHQGYLDTRAANLTMWT
jgi:WXG100 family type VII secretion target